MTCPASALWFIGSFARICVVLDHWPPSVHKGFIAQWSRCECGINQAHSAARFWCHEDDASDWSQAFIFCCKSDGARCLRAVRASSARTGSACKAPRLANAPRPLAFSKASREPGSKTAGLWFCCHAALCLDKLSGLRPTYWKCSKQSASCKVFCLPLAAAFLSASAGKASVRKDLSADTPNRRRLALPPRVRSGLFFNEVIKMLEMVATNISSRWPPTQEIPASFKSKRFTMRSGERLVAESQTIWIKENHLSNAASGPTQHLEQWCTNTACQQWPFTLREVCSSTRGNKKFLSPSRNAAILAAFGRKIGWTIRTCFPQKRPGLDCAMTLAKLPARPVKLPRCKALPRCVVEWPVFLKELGFTWKDVSPTRKALTTEKTWAAEFSQSLNRGDCRWNWPNHSWTKLHKDTGTTSQATSSLNIAQRPLDRDRWYSFFILLTMQKYSASSLSTNLGRQVLSNHGKVPGSGQPAASRHGIKLSRTVLKACTWRRSTGFCPTRKCCQSKHSAMPANSFCPNVLIPVGPKYALYSCCKESKSLEIFPAVGAGPTRPYKIPTLERGRVLCIHSNRNLVE